MESMLQFFCIHHYPHLHEMGECPGRPELLTDQGSASDWLKKETQIYKVRVGLGKKPTTQIE
jgi:hypothetical protein